MLFLSSPEHRILALQGAYNVTITAQNTANVQLLCLQIDFEIKPPTPPMETESDEAAAQVQEVSAARQRQTVVS